MNTQFSTRFWGSQCTYQGRLNDCFAQTQCPNACSVAFFQPYPLPLTWESSPTLTQEISPSTGQPPKHQVNIDPVAQSPPSLDFEIWKHLSWSKSQKDFSQWLTNEQNLTSFSTPLTRQTSPATECPARRPVGRKETASRSLWGLIKPRACWRTWI